MLSPIIPHQKKRVDFMIRLYIYWLLRHHPSGYPTSDQLLSPPIISDYFVNFPRPTPHSIPYSSSSSDLSSVQLFSPIIPHQQIRVHFVIRFYIWLVPAQDGPFFYTLSHFSALQNCVILFSTNFQIILILKKCTTQFIYLIM